MSRKARPEILMLENLVDAIGATAALRLVAFFGAAGAGTLFVPATATPGHRIEKVIGTAPFEYLVSTYGGETISLPALASVQQYQRAGAISSLIRHGVPYREVARALGLSERHVYGVAAQLRKDGLLDPVPGRERQQSANLETVLTAANEIHARLAKNLVTDSPEQQTAATRRAARLVERAGLLLREASEFTGGSQMILTAAACGALESAEAEMKEGANA